MVARRLRWGTATGIDLWRSKDQSANAAVLRRLGADEGTVRALGWHFWYGAPWFGTRLVTARRRRLEVLA